MKRSNRIINIFRGFVLLMVAVTMALIIVNRDKITVDRIVNLAPEHYALAAVVFLLFYAVKSISFVFPVTVLKVSAGLVFGPVLGTLVNLLGEAVCLTLPFLLARLILPNANERLFQKYPQAAFLIDRFQSRELLLPLLLRTMGFLPMDVISAVLGLTNLRYSRYILGSLCGVLPGVVVATCLGNAIREPSTPAFYLSLAISFLLSLFGVVSFLLLVRGGKTEQNDW